MSAIEWALFERVLPLLAWIHLAGVDSPSALVALCVAAALGIAVGVAMGAVVARGRRAADAAPGPPKEPPHGRTRISTTPMPAPIDVAVGGRGPRAPGRVARRPAPPRAAH